MHAAALPEPTQRLLLLAAADSVGDSGAGMACRPDPSRGDTRHSS